MIDGNYSQSNVDPSDQHRRPKGHKGQGLVEYALILALVAVSVIVILFAVGPAISQYLMDVQCTMTWQTTARAFTGGSSATTNASGNWHTDDYKFLLRDYQNGSIAWCGLTNHLTARPAFPSSSYVAPAD
jgi:Flp pilus assembly pilin Flp